MVKGEWYAYDYSELYSTADKQRLESQKKRSDFSSVFSVSVHVVQTLENEIRFDKKILVVIRAIRAIERSVAYIFFVRKIQFIQKKINREKQNKTKTKKGRTQKKN